MIITVLTDNMGNNGLTGEWGLSFYIEYRGCRLLLDAGQSGLFAENADKLGLSLADVDYAVLSHAHYDHADGMSVFLDRNSMRNFICRNSAGRTVTGSKRAV